MTAPGVYCGTKLVFVGDSNCMDFSSHSEGLGEGYDGDIAFASALETFGGGHNDPISVAFGGMSIVMLEVILSMLLCVIGDF